MNNKKEGFPGTAEFIFMAEFILRKFRCNKIFRKQPHTKILLLIESLHSTLKCNTFYTKM